MKPEDSTAWSDDGWQHIPYRSLLSSVNTTDWKALTTNNRAMRVKSLEFTIKKYLPLNEETNILIKELTLLRVCPTMNK
jgi:hypothetical protein